MAWRIRKLVGEGIFEIVHFPIVRQANLHHKMQPDWPEG